MTAIFLEEGAVVSRIGYCIGTQNSATHTAGFAALYDTTATPLLLAQTGAITVAAANTAYQQSLTKAVEITTSGIYYVGLSFTATTMPDFYGVDLSNAVMANPFATKQLNSRPTNSALGSVAPTTLTSFTTVNRRAIWFFLA
jgi:hypothetical protein